MVDEIVPAYELPIWQTHFEREPWGYHAMDQLFSKTAMQISQASGAIKGSVTVQDFMFSDRFENLQLDETEIAALSEQERVYYQRKSLVKRFRELDLTAEEFNQLSEAEQKDYSQRHFAQLNRALSNG